MKLWLSSLLFLTTFGTATAQDVADQIQPETTVAVNEQSGVFADKQIVVAANPLAANAGLAVLRKGGSAIDAAVAVQAMLGLVEPQSSGLGGGAFLVYYDAESRKLTTFDGRETAPNAATGALFLDADGKPMKFFDAVVGGRSIGVPGVVDMLFRAHEKHGKAEWATLFADVIQTSSEGFKVSPRLAGLIERDQDRLAGQPATKTYFFDDQGEPLAAGHLLKNPAYAASLKLIAEGGREGFYTGKIAKEIVAAATGHASNPGQITLDDIAQYKSIERPAVCIEYRGYDVCGMGPPSSGALTVGQILGLSSHFDLATLGKDDPEAWRIIGDASRLAFADRGLYMADSDFVSMPKGLLNEEYLKSRAELIRRPTALPTDGASPGEPPWDHAQLRLSGFELEQPSTTHFVIVDEKGNTVSMTASIESAFGSRQMAGGFLLNNELTDFSFAPTKDDKDVANRVEPGKRPRSSMSPTIILKDGKPAFAVGSPGGSRIIGYVATTIVGLIDWGMDMQSAISMPHLVNRFGTYDLEQGTDAVKLEKDLQALGFETNIRDLNSGLHGVTFHADGRLEGGADPRREGVAVGD